MSSATVEERARKKAERKLEKQRQAAQHDLPRSMRPSAAVKTLTVVLLVLVLIYFLFRFTGPSSRPPRHRPR